MVEPQRFPGWRYNASEQPVLCRDQEAVDALGPGWYKSPALIPTKPSPRRRVPRPQTGLAPATEIEDEDA